MFISIAVVGSDHPWRWLAGVIMAYLVVMSFSAILGSENIALAKEMLHGLEQVVTGSYGLYTVLFGNICSMNAAASHGHMTMEIGTDGFPCIGPDFSTWLKAVLLWIAVGGASICLAVYRRRNA
jgi:hypothetical protein